MAKRKKHTHRKGTRRRRRVSGVALNAKSPIIGYGAIAAGYFLGDKINAALAKVVPSSIDPKIVAAVEAVAGYLVRSKVKGTAGQLAGGVLMGAGVKAAIAAFKPATTVAGLPTIGDYQNMRYINGVPDSVRRVAGIAQGQSQSMQVIGGIGSAYNDR